MVFYFPVPNCGKRSGSGTHIFDAVMQENLVDQRDDIAVFPGQLMVLIAEIEGGFGQETRRRVDDAVRRDMVVRRVGAMRVLLRIAFWQGRVLRTSRGAQRG